MRCAVINSETNIVETIAIAEPSWDPGLGFFLVPLVDDEECLLGQLYNDRGSPRFTGTPTPIQRVYTSYQFLLRFTAEERAAFRAEAITDSLVADFQQLAGAAQEIYTDDPTTIAGMNYLVSIGILTEQRKLEVMG